MAMNSTGPISLGGATAGQSINLENGASATAQVSLNDSAVRSLAGVASGQITMPTDFYGKSNTAYVSYTFSSNTADAALNLSALPGYSAGKTVFTVTVNGGVYLYATSTGSYGLNITGGTTGDTLTLVNNGYIHGKGGQGGGNGGGSSGGPALNLGFGMTSCTINNTNGSAYIGGGGGGGAGSPGGGGGAGGGPGGGSGAGGGAYTGGTGASGSGGGGGGGGSAFPGSGGGGGYGGPFAGGQPGGGGSAGGGGGCTGGVKQEGFGGSGGGGNSSGGGGYSYGSSYSGGGGGWGASGGPGNSGGGGGGGKAVNTNGKSITWTSGNTSRVWGSVS